MATPMNRFLRRAALVSFMAFAAGGSASATTILVLGDSLTAGYGVERHEAFPAVLADKAKAAGHDVEVINGGVSGDTTAGGLRRLNWLLNRHVDILILGLGANDGLRGLSPETTAENLQAIIDAAKATFPDLRIVLAGMRMPPNLGPDYGRRFEEVFPQVAARNDALLVPFLLEGVGGNAAMNLGDRIHPNPAGHRIVAENVWQILRPLLEDLDGANAD